jgi:hypothetical protein
MLRNEHEGLYVVKNVFMGEKLQKFQKIWSYCYHLKKYDLE